jgi:adenosylhomocysteinase
MTSMLQDTSLAPEGRRKIEFARKRMPVLSAIEAELAERRPLAGERIAACLHVTTETANLCRALAAAGAEVAVCASNPLSTKDDVAAALVADTDVQVYARRGCSDEELHDQLDAALDIAPTLLVDDGADLTATIHSRRPELLDSLRAAAEVTSIGVQRLRAMEAHGVLRVPVVPVNDAQTKHLFDNRYGTGQNTIDGILRATNVFIAGAVFVVVGYGWCGRGIAARARGMGARVIVCEVEPIKVLEAVLEGFEVLPVLDAAELGDIFVTVTGGRDAIPLAALERMKSGAVVANSGHFDIEIDVAGLRRIATDVREVRPNVEELVLPSGAEICLLAEGRLVGQACAEAHPASVMDMSFATMALAVEYLAGAGRGLPAGLHALPAALEQRVARLKLAALGVRHDTLTAAQEAYLASWELGS